jgi:outer membrane beta-barrel protein
MDLGEARMARATVLVLLFTACVAPAVPVAAVFAETPIESVAPADIPPPPPVESAPEVVAPADIPAAGAIPAPQPAAGDAASATAPAAATVASDSLPFADAKVVGTPVAVVRTGPGPEHAIVATVSEGDVLTVDAKTGAWYHVRLGDARSGWMHESLLQQYVDPRKFQFAPDRGRPSRMRSFHLVAYGGNYAADREDNGLLFGARIGYSVTRRFAFEAGVGYTGVKRTTYVLEQIFGLRLEEEDFDLFFYEAGVSMDILPGRRVSPFVTVGLGASMLDSRVEPTYAFGLGTKFFMSKRTALRWEMRDHRLKGGNRFTRFSGDNLEFSGGVEFLF